MEEDIIFSSCVANVSKKDLDVKNDIAEKYINNEEFKKLGDDLISRLTQAIGINLCNYHKITGIPLVEFFTDEGESSYRSYYAFILSSDEVFINIMNDMFRIIEEGKPKVKTSSKKILLPN